MRKFLAVILTIVYVSVTIGFTLSYHYCMDELVAVSMVAGDDDHNTCSECGMSAGAHDCCSHADHPVKLIVDQTTAATFFHAFQSQSLYIPLLFNSTPGVCADALLSGVATVPGYTLPPILPTPLFIRHCVYLI